MGPSRSVARGLDIHTEPDIVKLSLVPLGPGGGGAELHHGLLQLLAIDGKLQLHPRRIREDHRVHLIQGTGQRWIAKIGELRAGTPAAQVTGDVGKRAHRLQREAVEVRRQPGQAPVVVGDELQFTREMVQTQNRRRLAGSVLHRARGGAAGEGHRAQSGKFQPQQRPPVHPEPEFLYKQGTAVWIAAEADVDAVRHHAPHGNEANPGVVEFQSLTFNLTQQRFLEESGEANQSQMQKQVPHQRNQRVGGANAEAKPPPAKADDTPASTSGPGHGRRRWAGFIAVRHGILRALSTFTYRAPGNSTRKPRSSPSHRIRA